MTAHYVYRCLDAQQELIYVGASKDVAARMVQHNMTSFWAPQVAKVTVRVFPSKEAALEQERLAIAREQPKYNLIGKRTGRSQWTRADCDAEITKLFSRGVGHGSRRIFEKLFTGYLLRFGERHPLVNDITRSLDAWDVQWAASEARRREHDERQSADLERREAADLAAHKEQCCSCRYGIVLTGEILTKYGDDEAKAEAAAEWVA